MSIEATASTAPRVPRVWWVGVAALVVYILLAAVLGNVVGDLAGGDESAEFALSHFVPLPIGILLGLLFLKWARWGPRVWVETPTPALVPRRRWLIAIPVLMVALSLSQITSVPWADQTVTSVLVVVLATVMVGVGEELYCRGILLESIRARHGELTTLLATSFLFGFAHVVGSLWDGSSLGTIAFQVTFLAMNGSLLYWVRRVTGRLWVAMAVHALTDCMLYLESTPTRAADALAEHGDLEGQVLPAVLQFLLIGLAVAGVVSAAREDLRTRRAARPAIEATPV